MSLSLDDFIKAEIKRIHSFAEYWKKEHTKNEKSFPMQMEDGNEGAWDEMLLIFKDETKLPLAILDEFGTHGGDWYANLSEIASIKITTGYFVDWNGDTRRFESPGDGYTCRISDRSFPSVDVIDPAGFVCHEATFFPTLEAVCAAGIKVNLIEHP